VIVEGDHHWFRAGGGIVHHRRISVQSDGPVVAIIMVIM